MFRHRFVARMFDAIVNFIFLFAIALLMGGFLLALRRHGESFQSGMRDLDGYLGGALAVIVLLLRSGVRRLPSFLMS